MGLGSEIPDTGVKKAPGGINNGINRSRRDVKQQDLSNNRPLKIK
jgi:hypothetical protein